MDLKNYIFLTNSGIRKKMSSKLTREQAIKLFAELISLQRQGSYAERNA